MAANSRDRAELEKVYDGLLERARHWDETYRAKTFDGGFSAEDVMCEVFLEFLTPSGPTWDPERGSLQALLWRIFVFRRIEHFRRKPLVAIEHHTSHDTLAIDPSETYIRHDLAEKAKAAMRQNDPHADRFINAAENIDSQRHDINKQLAHHIHQD